MVHLLRFQFPLRCRRSIRALAVGGRRYQVGLRSLLLSACLLGAALGSSGLYLRIVFSEWRAADELHRHGARVDSNFQEFYGLHLSRRRIHGPATSLERTAARPIGLVLYNQVDREVTAQLKKLHKLRRLALVGDDIAIFHLGDLIQDADLREVTIACQQIDGSHIDMLAELPKLSELDLCRTSLTAEAVSRLAHLRQLDRLHIDSREFVRRRHLLQNALPNTEIYRR